MGAFMIYIFKWALCLVLLYIPFTVLLKKETFATFNRMLLIGIIAASAILPAITVTYPVEVDIVRVIDATGNIVTETHESELLEKEDTIPTIDNKGYHWKEILTTNTVAGIYLIGIALTLLLRIIETVKIVYSMRRDTVKKEIYNGMTLHCYANEIAPFSWFGHVAISLSDYREYGKEILLHEEGHYRNRHSWDMLLISAVKSLQWFNPFAYMIANDMKEVHEYEADRYVLKHLGNTSAYQLLLLRKAVGETAFNLANNFSRSSARKRIMMMARKSSAKIVKAKALAFAPMAILFLSIFARPEYVYSIVEEREIETAKPPGIAVSFSRPPEADCTPIPLNMLMRGTTEVLQKKIEPITESEQDINVRELSERKYEEHATEVYHEQVDLSGTEFGKRMRSMNIIRCNARIEFISDKEGNSTETTCRSCNITIAGNTDNNIGDYKREATDFALEYIRSKKWLPAIKRGKIMRTIYDAHIILNF